MTQDRHCARYDLLPLTTLIWNSKTMRCCCSRSMPSTRAARHYTCSHVPRPSHRQLLASICTASSAAAVRPSTIHQPTAGAIQCHLRLFEPAKPMPLPPRPFALSPAPLSPAPVELCNAGTLNAKHPSRRVQSRSSIGLPRQLRTSLPRPFIYDALAHTYAICP